MLGIVFGLARFHHYAYGRHVTIETDHKPLESITRKHLTNAPPRLVRMLFRIQKYDFTVKYVPGKDIPSTYSLWWNSWHQRDNSRNRWCFRVETRENQRHEKMRWNNPSVNQYCDKRMATVHKSMSRRHSAVLELQRRDPGAQWCSSERKTCHHTREHARGGFDEDTHRTSRHRKISTASTRYRVLVQNQCRHWQHGQAM